MCAFTWKKKEKKKRLRNGEAQLFWTLFSHHVDVRNEARIQTEKKLMQSWSPCVGEASGRRVQDST